MPKLVLVYNADNGFFNAVTDMVHKVISPSTYQCSLCKYTYGIRGMIGRWSGFLESLGVPLEFLHRDEFLERYGDARVHLPLILLEHGDEVDVVLDADEIDACGDLDSLIATLQKRMAERPQARAG